MNSLDVWVIPVTVLVFTAGTAFVLALAVYRYRQGNPSGVGAVWREGSHFMFVCTECGWENAFQYADLRELPSTERGAIRQVVGGAIVDRAGELRCPQCGVLHSFTMGGRLPRWLGANLGLKRARLVQCHECGRRLRRPGWPPGDRDGRVLEAPLLPDHGLVCSCCGAVVCVSCAERATDKAAEGGAYRCPRCRRYPVVAVFHGTFAGRRG